MALQAGFAIARARAGASVRQHFRSASSGMLVRAGHRKVLAGEPTPVFCGRTDALILDARTSAKRTFAAVAIPEVMLDGISFGNLLRYLDQQYGLAHRVVEDKLSELANILGYEGVDRDTTINFSDTKILMEEVGTYPATPLELTSWVAEQEQERAQECEHNAEAAEQGVHMYYNLQSYPDLLEMARKQGATVEPCNKHGGWTRVTTASNEVILFKSVKGKLRWSTEAEE